MVPNNSYKSLFNHAVLYLHDLRNPLILMWTQFPYKLSKATHCNVLCVGDHSPLSSTRCVTFPPAFACNIPDDFQDCRLTLQTNTSLFSMCCHHSHAFWKTFQRVTHPKITPSPTHLIMEFLSNGLTKRRCILLVISSTK